MIDSSENLKTESDCKCRLIRLNLCVGTSWEAGRRAVAIRTRPMSKQFMFWSRSEISKLGRHSISTNPARIFRNALIKLSDKFTVVDNN